MQLEAWKDVLSNQLITYNDSIILRFLYVFLCIYFILDV